MIYPFAIFEVLFANLSCKKFLDLKLILFLSHSPQRKTFDTQANQHDEDENYDYRMKNWEEAVDYILCKSKSTLRNISNNPKLCETDYIL